MSKGNGKNSDREIEKRYYITEIFHLRDHASYEEKKEFKRRLDLESAKMPARKNGNTAYCYIIHFVEEEVSYMTDYIFDEEDHIIEKHRNPVTISKKEGTCLFGKDDGCE